MAAIRSMQKLRTKKQFNLLRGLKLFSSLLVILITLSSKEGLAVGLPLQGSDVAISYDRLYSFLFWISVFFGILIIGGMFYFIYAYRKSIHAKTKYITHNNFLEVTWTLIPAILLFFIFGWGYSVYLQMKRVPVDALEIKVLGFQWAWQFQYDDGRITNNEIFVPTGKPVKLIMTSKDVLHGFFVPNFRVKSDVVPGMYTSIWFESNVSGRHQVYCTAYCGASHSLMLAEIISIDPAEFEAWRRGKKIYPKSIPRAYEPIMGELMGDLMSQTEKQDLELSGKLTALKKALER